MTLRFLFLSFVLLLVSCVSWDSNKFEPTKDELDAAKKIETKQRTDTVDMKKCKKIGNLKLNTLSRGQSVTVVAARKYKGATLVKHIDSHMDGGISGESSFDFFEVYNCHIFSD